MEGKFSIATLQCADGPQGAIKVADRFYLLKDLDSSLGTTTKGLLEEWSTNFPKLKKLAQHVSNDDGIESDKAHILAPILYPDNLLAVGANYADHLKEMGLPVEKWPLMPFYIMPSRSALVGPGQTVRHPTSTKQFDWECELAVVLGKQIRAASREEVADAIAGYSIGLDMSCRDLIKTNTEIKIDLVRGKAQDTMAPCGPVIVPKQFMPDIGNLHILLSVNGEKMIDGSTKDMIYEVDEAISIINGYVTLYPGDIIFTGSPAGSAAVRGNRWLKPGDHIHAVIEGIDPFDVWIQKPLHN